MTQQVSDLQVIIFPTEHAVAERTPERRSTVLHAWLLSKRSANTREAYQRDLIAYFEWFDSCVRDQLGVADVFSVKRVHLDGYRTDLEQRQFSPASIARRLSAISSFYDYAIGEYELMPGNPVARVERPAVSKESATPSLERSDGAKLLAAARAAGPMEHALIGLLLLDGVRVSEVVGLDTSAFGRHAGHCTASVVRKGGKKERLVVTAETSEALKTYLGARRGAVFVGNRDGQRLRRQQVDRILVKLCQQAGVPKISPHGCRHTLATALFEDGVPARDVQRQLGHKRLETTLIYDAARENLDRSVVHRAAELFGAE